MERHGRFRPLHYLPVAASALALAQALWLPRRTRALAAAIDGVVVLGVLGVLASKVPFARWPAVLEYAGLALFEWHRGYLEGMPTP